MLVLPRQRQIALLQHQHDGQLVAPGPATRILDPYETGMRIVAGTFMPISSYTGNLLQIRRTTPDTTTKEIPQNADGTLNETEITNFIGSGDGIALRAYNGADGGTTYVSFTDGSFEIANSGVIHKRNGNPYIKRLDDTGDALLTDSVTLTEITALSAHLIAAAKANGRLVSDSGAFIPLLTPNATSISFFDGAASRAVRAISSLGNIDCAIGNTTNASDTYRTYNSYDGGSITSETSTNNIPSTAGWGWGGKYISQGEQKAGFEMYLFVIWESDQSSDMDTIADTVYNYLS